MYILNPKLSDETIKNINDEIKNIFSQKKGSIVESKEAELKKLAYPIKKFEEGFYNSLLVLADSDIIKEFNHKANVTEEILRFILINREGMKYDKQSYFSRKNN
ncbi:MAG: 30S ribosomal protein S6 [Candidatus Phytoplasma cynodontis]|nr:MAG: 30S ribosomal protein S6 [Candidatus Phytoplasma cynodontis]